MSASAGAAIAASIESDLHRYVGFGNKQAGGTGDKGCGDWLASELEQAGFAVERQAVSVPWFAPDRCEIAADGARAALWPQPIVRLTGADGLSGPRSEEHTSELQSLMRLSYAVFCLKNKTSNLENKAINE